MQGLFRASKIDDEDILESIMEALNDIVRVNYDYMLDYINEIGSLTTQLIDSKHDKPAQLAIEVWSTISEVELGRIQNNIEHKCIIQKYHESIINIMIRGLEKFDSEIEGQDLNEMPEINLSIAAG